MNLDDSIKNLENWTESLQISVKNTVPQVRKVFEEDYKLIPGCPSKASAALMNLRQVEQIIDELNGAMKILEKAIREEG